MRATHDERDLVLEVDQRRMIADRVCLLSLRHPGGESLPSWSPGAHIDLELAPGLSRQYSLCGTPQDEDTWEIAVLLEEESRGGSASVHAELTPGRSVPVRGPRNLFPLERASDYLFIAGGIGVAPLVPMVDEVAARGDSWRLVYGGRNRAAMAFADRLSQQYGDRVRLVPQDEEGLLPVTQVVASAGEGTALYCCGPEQLITEVEKAHAGAGRGTLHVERFTPRDLPAPRDTASFEVEAVRSGRVVTVHPDVSILDALDAAGVSVLSSCREGICGTCELSVLGGVPDHRDSILTEAERQASETMFVCVSRCLSPRLVLDA